MAKTARAVSVLLAGVCLCCLPAFVPGPGRFARSVAPAAVGAGALGMLGAAPAYADKIDDAAKVLSEKSYPFLKEIDWTSDVYAKLPTQPPLKAIANMDSKGVATLADYTAINCHHANTSWTTSPRWWRSPLFGDQIRRSYRMQWVVGALCISLWFGYLLSVRCRRLCLHGRADALPGQSAKHLKRLFTFRRMRQRRRKKRPKPKVGRKLVAICALPVGGQRVPGRQRRRWMGYTCGPRVGAHGLFVYVPGKLADWGAAGHGRARRVRGPPGAAAGVLPWDMVDTPCGPVPWAQFCRGGGRDADNAVLEGLQEFLGRFRHVPVQGDSQAEAKGSGKDKGKRGKGEGGKPAFSSSSTTPLEANAGNKGKGQGGSIRNEGELLAELELEKLVARAKQNPSTLLEDLQGLARRASAGYGSGRAARLHRATLAKQAAEGHGTVDKQPVKHVEPEFCRPVGGDEDGNAPWTVVAKRRVQDNEQLPVQNWIVDPLAGGVVSSALAVKRISDGLPLQATLVVAHTQSEVDKLISLARAHGITDKVAVVCRFTPDGKAGTMQLPSVGP
ncbi:unnamed protein product [Symbiodinium pilosum]|uniref:Uncharacterized protein n=1 Tax=Symbiodinium pilosum TaxID=2952 RepID=A0A812RQU6_SYMPI|nr:unnamed protein product [Symbiodinium pilosum]